MTNQTVSNPIASNSGAVACADETGDLAQCLADRLTQNKQDAIDRIKKRFKTQDEGVGFSQFQPQTPSAQQPLENRPLSQVLLQLTAAENAENIENAKNIETKPALTPMMDNASTVKPLAVRIEQATAESRDDAPTAPTLADKPASEMRQTRTAIPMSILPAGISAPVVAQPAADAVVITRADRNVMDEQSDKMTGMVPLTARVTGGEPSQVLPAVVETAKPQESAMPTTQLPTVLNRHAADEVSPAVISKNISLDFQADQVEVRYSVAEQATVKLQVAEQTIAPVSSNVRLNEMLVGQASLAAFDAGWTLQGAKQTRPYYLAVTSSGERVKAEDKTWKERDQ